ncbi:aspartate 1-decarboxylase [candidate division WOR-3 bacterium]|nr:aspartate 1-decarboxylase [candidate division WOR-3 bacterium]
MLRCLVRSKTRRLVVTDKNPQYEGSPGFGSGLMWACDILSCRTVRVIDVNHRECIKKSDRNSPRGG